MNRRNFFGGLLATGAGFFILPGAGRIWVPEKRIVRAQFESFFIDQEPIFDELILEQWESPWIQFV